MSLRPIYLTLALATLLASTTSAARADRLNGATLKLKLRLPDSDGTFTLPTDEIKNRYFNQAHCACDVPSKPFEYQVEYTWAADRTSALTESLHVWAGANCSDSNTEARDMTCTELETFAAGEIPAGGTDKRYRISQALTSTRQPTCADATTTINHWIVTQSGTTWDADNRFKLFESDFVADGEAPPLPTDLELKPREGGLTLAWTVPTSTADIEYYQVLCAEDDGTKVRSNPARFDTPRALCDGTDLDNPAATLTTPLDGVPGTLPLALKQVDPTFVCAETTGTAESITVEGLENGKAYWLVLTSVDKAGNVRATHIDRPVTPQEVIDFWEVINEEDGYVQGGFCVAQVGKGGGLGGALVIAAAGLFATRRRRRRRNRAAAALIVSLVLVPSIASAQSTYSPYWEDDAPQAEGFAEPTWTLGLRLGPYRPSIDDHFASNPGPYARTFKKDSALFAIDVHRVWPLLRGQLGVGGSAGYYTNSALSFVKGSDPNDPMRPRASGNLTRLSIAPLSVTAIYRATILDDQFGVPVVPYLRGGLAYYLWWIKTPSDELSVARSCDTCEDRAIGGTIGLVAAIGLAVRAERIDGDAAASMRDSGLEHAGFYAELELGYVDGFGDETKLSVGDSTWFGGLSFEF